MICYKCGYENKGGDKICSKCMALLDYREIDAKKIDISGLALTEEDVEEQVEKKTTGSGGRKVVIAGIVAVTIAAAVVFIPQYLVQAKAVTILEAITFARQGVESYVKQHRRWPATESDIQSGVPEYLATEVKVVIKRGVIVLSIPEEPGKQATISPSVKKGRVVWDCENGGIGPEYLPLGCFK